MSTAETDLDLRITATIRKSPHLRSHRLCVENEAGRVVLRGIVNSYYTKQMAQETLRRVAGVERIENHLEVHWS